MRSHQTFQEELENVGGIPGVLLTELEASSQRPPVEAINEHWRWIPNNSSAEEDREVLFWQRIAPPMVNDLPDEIEWLSVPGFDGVLAPVGLEWVEKTKGRGGQRPADFFSEEFGLDVAAAVDALSADKEQLRLRVASATAQLGTDAFGTYLPWHKHARSQHTPWGMWFFLEPLVAWAAMLKDLAASLGISIPNTSAFDLAFLITYRHEQFHFHVERFALRQEVLQRRPIYLPYDRGVYSAAGVQGTEHWLEEALAQAVVLESRFIHRRVGIKPRVLRKLLETEFCGFGPGYRDFACLAYDGPADAHRLLGAQIASAAREPGFNTTEYSTPKREYAAAPELVPGYVVLWPLFISQFQLSMPKARQWKKFAARNGFRCVGSGPGDHEIWAINGEKFHLNTRGSELDLASAKAAAKILKKPLRQMIEEIRGS